MPPWEKYQKSTSGPWKKYQTAAPLAGQRVFERDKDEQLYRENLAGIQQERSGPVVPQYVSGPDGGELNLQDVPAEDLARFQTQQQRAKEAEQRAFDESRSPLRRVLDTSTFMVSTPIRAATQGQYGLGDVAGLVSKEAGETYRQQESDFARANRPWLEPMAQAGEYALGIPFLQSLGVPARGVGATARTLANRLPGPRRGASPRATPAQAYGPSERIRDRQAFVSENVPEFAPAFTSKGTARVAKTIEEYPLVGGTVRVPKREVEAATAARQQGLARRVGAVASDEDVGLVAQRGLERFRGANLEDLERSRVQQLGLTPDRPARNVTGNVRVDQPSRFSSAQLTDRQLGQAASSRVDLPGSTRARIEDLSPQEVQRIISMPARNTSFATKASALYRRAEDAIPRMMRANQTANPNMIATRNSGQMARGLMQAEESASISGGVLEGRFGGLVRALSNPQRNFTLDNLRAARTEVGRALSNFGDFDTRLDRTQLKQLYGALSDDYQSGLVALAARARRNSRLDPSDANYVAPSVANQADRALQQYRVADRYFRQGVERMDRFMNVLGANSLEQAAKRIGRYLKENTQDVRALESMASALRPEEWRSVLGNVIEGLGRFTPGSQQAEQIFSFERFATDWNKISQNPRVMTMFRRSLGDEVVNSLNNLGRIAERMKFYETTKNYSGSGPAALTGAGLTMMYDPTLWPLLISGVAGAGVTGKVLTSRSFARWVNALNRAQQQVGSSMASTRQAVRPHLRRLSRLAAREPDPEVSAALGATAYYIDEQLEAASRQGDNRSPQQ